MLLTKIRDKPHRHHPTNSKWMGNVAKYTHDGSYEVSKFGRDSQVSLFFGPNPDSDSFLMVPDCVLGVPDCLFGVPDCYWAFSAMDWAFPFTY